MFLEAHSWSEAQQIGRCLESAVKSPCNFSGSVLPSGFLNGMLDSNSETLRRVLKADLHLASFDSSCWSAQVSNACNGLQSSAMFNQKMLRAWFPCKSSFAICVSDI